MSLTYQWDDEVASWNGDGELSDIEDFDSEDEDAALDDDAVLDGEDKENTINNLQNETRKAEETDNNKQEDVAATGSTTAKKPIPENGSEDDADEE